MIYFKTQDFFLLNECFKTKTTDYKSYRSRMASHEIYIIYSITKAVLGIRILFSVQTKMNLAEAVNVMSGI